MLPTESDIDRFVAVSDSEFQDWVKRLKKLRKEQARSVKRSESAKGKKPKKSAASKKPKKSAASDKPGKST